MNSIRTCHICQTQTDTFCPVCTAAFEHRRPADDMTGEEREAEMRVLDGPLEVSFDLVHQRIEELVGRPVWTHEMGMNWEGLVAEARTRQHPSLDDVVGLIPEDKLVFVVAEQ